MSRTDEKSQIVEELTSRRPLPELFTKNCERCNVQVFLYEKEGLCKTCMEKEEPSREIIGDVSDAPKERQLVKKFCLCCSKRKMIFYKEAYCVECIKKYPNLPPVIFYVE